MPKFSHCIFICALVFTHLMAGCAHNTGAKSVAKNNPTAKRIAFQPVDAKKLLPVAAQFQTLTSSNSAPAKSTTIHWRLLRNDGQLELVHLDGQTSEIWQRTSQDLWFYSKVFHQDKQVIEYSPMDLNVLGVKAQWLPLALAIDPEILSTIGSGKPGKAFYGWESIVFTGTVNGTDYEIQWLPKLAIAARTVFTENGITTTTEMQQPYLFSESPWPISNVQNYRLIDYSDLGDMERDPFVIKVQSHIMGGHHHDH